MSNEEYQVIMPKIANIIDKHVAKEVETYKTLARERLNTLQEQRAKIDDLESQVTNIKAEKDEWVGHAKGIEDRLTTTNYKYADLKEFSNRQTEGIKSLNEKLEIAEKTIKQLMECNDRLSKENDSLKKASQVNITVGFDLSRSCDIGVQDGTFLSDAKPDKMSKYSDNYISKEDTKDD